MRLADAPGDSSGHERTASAVILGSDPDSACDGWHRGQRITESGSDPNIMALHRRRNQIDSCQRILNKSYSLFLHTRLITPKRLRQAKPSVPTRRIGVRAQFGDAPVTHTHALLPNWDPTPNLLPTVVILTLVNPGYRSTTNSAVILGSDPDSACDGWHRGQRITESGSDPNITAHCRRHYPIASCQRKFNKRYSLFFHLTPSTPPAALEHNFFIP